MAVIPSLLSPELVCSSPGAKAANQGLWWEERDGLKLHPSQSTGGAHESVTSRRFFPRAGGSLQIDSDSTPLTSETPSRASPIKSLLWFPLLIINAPELDRPVRHVWLGGFLGTCTRLCERGVRLSLWCLCLARRHRGARFHAVSTSCLWRCLPPNHDFRPITSLTGNPRCHIGFQQDIRRGASLLTAETAAGKAGTLFPGCATPSPWLLHKYWSNFQNTSNAVALLKPWRHFLLPWWQIMGSICTAESNRKWHFIAGRWLLRHPEPHHNNNYWRDAVT